MVHKEDKSINRVQKHYRMRKDLIGTADRPRLSVFRSESHIYAQIIDDEKQVTLVSASTCEKAVKAELKSTANIEAAQAVGKLIAERAKDKKISSVVFDRGGFLYHGRVKALADAAREAGLEF